MTTIILMAKRYSEWGDKYVMSGIDGDEEIKKHDNPLGLLNHILS
jgi:hypothetical protein